MIRRERRKLHAKSWGAERGEKGNVRNLLGRGGGDAGKNNPTTGRHVVEEDSKKRMRDRGLMNKV